MTSAIDPTLGGSLTGTGEVTASEADGAGSMQLQLETAASEITALQAALAALRFTALGDTPNTYATFGKQVLQVNAAENATEFDHDVGHQDPGRDAVGNADKTLVVGTAKHVQNWATTLTANRTCTLPTANVYAGLAYVIWRSAAGSYYLRVTNLGASAASIFDLYQNESLFVEWDGSQWNITDFAYTTRAIDMRDSLLNRAKIGSFTEQVSTVTPSAGVVTLDCDNYQVFVGSLTGNVTTVAVTNVDASVHTNFFFYLVQDGTGGRTVAWTFTINGVAATIKWGGGTVPTVTSAANSVDKYAFSILPASATVIYGEFVQAYA